MVLACLVAAAIAVLDRLRDAAEGTGRGRLRWAFFALVGLTALAKGIGFGAALVAATAVPLVWPGTATGRPSGPCGSRGAGSLAVVAGAGLAGGGPGAASGGAGGSGPCTSPTAWRPGPSTSRAGRGGQYAPGAALGQMLPWTPLALVGAWASLRRACGRSGGGRRPAPLGLGGRAGGPALAGDGQERPLRDPRPAPVVDLGGPGAWCGWATGLRRGAAARLRRCAAAAFAGLAVAYGLATAWALPRLRPPRRWSGPSTIRRAGGPGRRAAGVALRRLGPPALPHAVRPRAARPGRPPLLPRPPRRLAPGRRRPGRVPPGGARGPFAVIGRARDVPGLERLGRVEEIARGPVLRAGPRGSTTGRSRCIGSRRSGRIGPSPAGDRTLR